MTLAIVAAATVGLTTLGWLPNLGWHREQRDSLVAAIEGELRKIEPDTNMIHIGSTPPGPGGTAFVVTADTRLLIGNEEARFADLREGMQVKVVYERRDDTRLAWSIEASTARDARNADAAVQPSATPSAAPAVPDSRPEAAAVAGSQSQRTEPSGADGPPSPIQAPSPSPPPKPSADVGSSRAHSSTSTEVPAPGPRPKPSLGRDPSSPGRRAVNAVHDDAPRASRPAAEDPTRLDPSISARRSTGSDERDPFDPSAVVDWLLRDREQTRQTLPDVGGRR